MTEPIDFAKARCEHHLEIETGTVLKGVGQEDWAFICWLNNTAGRYPLFMQIPVSRSPGGELRPRWASPVFLETLLRYFPDAGLFLKRS